MDYALLVSSFTQRHSGQGWPRQRMLHECLRAAIRDGTLAAGTRLVATRTLAAELGMARNTVLYAYEQLACEGYAVSDRRGTVVAPVAAAIASAGASAAASVAAVAAAHAATRAQAQQPFGEPHHSLSRRARNLREVGGPAHQMGAFVPGVPALDAFPAAHWRRLLDRVWRGLNPAQLNYGDPAGEEALRSAIADHLRASRGVLCGASQVFITDGTQSSLDLCARACADEGDTVWIEHPGYLGALAAFRGAGLKVEGIAVDEDGIAPTPQDWRQRPPRLIYTTPSHQYPVGGVLALERRLALIAGARAAGALIIEDDYDSEFRHDGPPLAAMQGLAPDAPVLYLGTFSKTMFPALRIGFLVAPQGLAEPLAAMRAQSAARGRVAEQLALAEFLRSGQFALHLRRMRRLYRQRRDVLVASLRQHMGTIAEVHGASAGMHLALRFTVPALDDTAISARLAQEGIVAHALSMHATCERTQAWHGLMLGYAQIPADLMEGFVRRLAAVVHLAAYEAKLPEARPPRVATRKRAA
ncbi:MocR-like pyridoxine biosynthesis transcription factor PdxR [Pseudoduganella aquatica]|uniref:Aminotransferase class I/II-fold pyridoxal phosphate-dependent enzyme n=1 Tax=Pseudoduganella aquatica TaxID=2660641 RepID=A0A7X4H9F3_9BURK|nr:PLP-dependent aminotransferase family protein [Pseudoduganella aquatica]MYN07101.1 aminotransferase class I/II-fold pyridoxal phosphate-dependent enzyme [Pseudoduganella aquatica]